MSRSLGSPYSVSFKNDERLQHLSELERHCHSQRLPRAVILQTNYQRTDCNPFSRCRHTERTLVRLVFFQRSSPNFKTDTNRPPVYLSRPSNKSKLVLPRLPLKLSILSFPSPHSYKPGTRRMGRSDGSHNWAEPSAGMEFRSLQLSG